jgi:hypothetical protein
MTCRRIRHVNAFRLTMFDVVKHSEPGESSLRNRAFFGADMRACAVTLPRMSCRDTGVVR